MNCETALDRMLEADIAEIRGEVDGALARHLSACEQCAAVARTLVAELDRVDADLEAWAHAGDVDAAVDQVIEDRGSRIKDRGSRIEDRGRWSVGRDASNRGTDGSSRTRLLRYRWVPLAAAAVVAGVLLFPRPEPEWGAVPEAPEIESTVAVRPPPDRSAAILKTGNPNITIVWLYDQEEET